MDNKKRIKLGIVIFIFTLLIYVIYDNKQTIINKISYINSKYLQRNIRQVLVDNEYKKATNYEYIKINNNVIINNYEELKNSLYTFLDAGWEKYIIKCDPDYVTCLNDVKKMAEDKIYLTNLSNFVHPFNSFDNINTQIASNGKITLTRKPRYDNKRIKEINKKIDEIYNKYYDSSKNVEDNIKIFHDYIINNSKYDSNNKTGKSNINSSTAYGVLFEGLGICSGYADTMSLFLDKMNVKNYKISSDDHVWNLVYVNGKWKHLDLTWDDPISPGEENLLEHEYFLIDTIELESKRDSEHSFDKDIYIEAK